MEEALCTQDPAPSQPRKERMCSHCKALASKGKLPSEPQRAHYKP